MTRFGDSRKPTLALAAVLVLVGTVLVLAQAAGQEPAPPAADQLFGEEIDVRVVNQEVVVQDGDGNRIEELGAEDSRVLVDGEEVRIEYFTDVVLGRRSIGGGRRAEQPAIPLELRRDLAPAPDSIVPYHADVTMRRAPHTLVVTVHDPVSRLTAVARVEVEP